MIESKTILSIDWRIRTEFAEKPTIDPAVRGGGGCPFSKRPWLLFLCVGRFRRLHDFRAAIRNYERSFESRSVRPVGPSRRRWVSRTFVLRGRPTLLRFAGEIKIFYTSHATGRKFLVCFFFFLFTSVSLVTTAFGLPRKPLINAKYFPRPRHGDRERIIPIQMSRLLISISRDAKSKFKTLHRNVFGGLVTRTDFDFTDTSYVSIVRTCDPIDRSITR